MFKVLSQKPFEPFERHVMTEMSQDKADFYTGYWQMVLADAAYA